MGWDSVPWFVGGGAQHSPEVARLLSYVAFGGAEGILGPGDLKVQALAVPGSSVRVAPGACAILSRALGGAYQAYAGRMPTEDTVAIAATGSAGGRSDLIVARIEDPNLSGEPWGAPVDPAVGPYIFTRVIANVPATTTTVAELGLGYSAVALARVDIPASTATITDAMIVDLRKLARPRRERRLFTAVPAADDLLTSPAFAQWPAVATWDVDVPAWATKAVLLISLWSLRANRFDVNTAGGFWGQLRGALSGGGYTPNAGYDVNIPAVNNYDRVSAGVAATLTLGAGIPGTRQRVWLEGLKSGGNTSLTADTNTTITADVEFVESPV